jgi:hypothetical protein
MAPLGIHFLDGAADDRALRVLRDVARERILRELLDAERDALALRVDRQDHGLDVLALLVAAHGFLAGMSQEMSDRCTRPSMLPGRPMKMPKSVIDLIWPDLVAAVVVLGELLPRVDGLHCLMPSEMRRRSSSMSSTMTSTSIAGLHDLGRD